MIEIRRKLIASFALGASGVVHSQGLFERLAKDALNSVVNQGGNNGSNKKFDQNTSGPQQAQRLSPRPRFEDSIPLSTYINAYRSNFVEASARAVQSPIKGLGLIKFNRSNIQPLFINADATFYGFRSWTQVDSFGNRRPLSQAENDTVKSELAGRIDWGQLVGPVWGAGSGPKVLVYTAIDCPPCIEMERELAAHNGRMQAELYYLPKSLDPNKDAGRPIWCSNDAVASWNQAISRRLDLRSGFDCDKSDWTSILSDLFMPFRRDAQGRIYTSTPTIVFPDGSSGNWSQMKNRILL